MKSAQPQKPSFLHHPNLALLGIWLVATAFNLTKAVHIDDTIYLEIARWINVSPLHPLSGEVNWVNTLEPIYRISSSPLLFIYGLAAVLRWFGEFEVALHAFMAIFTGLCVWGFYNLSSLLKIQHKMALTTMLAWGPAFIPSQNLMLDVPLMAWSILFFWTLFATTEATSSRKTWLFVLAGLFAGAAALTKYPGLVLFPLLAFYLIINRHFSYVWVILIPVSIFGAWCAFNVFDYGGIHVLQTNSGSVDSGSVHLYRLAGLPLLQLPHRLLDGVICLGATSPFVLLSLLYLMQSRRRHYGLFCVAAIAVLSFILTFVFQGEDIVPALLHVGFLSCALILFLALGHSLWHSMKEKPVPGTSEEESLPPIFRTMIVTWLVVNCCFVLLLVPFMAVRHVLIMMPAILLLLGVGVFPKMPGRAIFWTAATSALMGFWMGASDWQAANVARTQAQQIRGALPSHANVYFVGHWGWQWYAARSGMKQYDLKKTYLVTGDYIVAPHSIGVVPVAARYAAYMQPIRDIAADSSSSLLCRTISNQPSANFYGGGWNPLPWTFSSQPMETFTIFQISPTPAPPSS